MDKNYNILAVDDAKDTLILLEFDLVEEGYNVITAGSGEQALAILETESINLILLDMYMPGISGLELLKVIKKTPEIKNLPIIMLSASDDEDQIVSALDHGADDYVTKPYIAKVLLARIKTSLRLFEKTFALEQMAKTDYLTGLNNKGSFDTLSIKAISRAKREGYPITMAMLDIDFFKQVNDKYGHEAGDKVLIEFSARLADCFRDYDIIGRIGGEEFAVCMPTINLEDAFQACDRFRKKIEMIPIEFTNSEGDNFALSITVSIGLSQECSLDMEFEEILRKADTNLYKAKNNGRNLVQMSDSVEGSLSVLPIDMIEEKGMDHQNESSSDEKFPGIDFEIGVSNVLGDESLFKDIVQMFYEDHQQDSVKIGNAISTSDQQSCKHLVHTLKGVACSVGAMQLFEYVKVLDVAINNQETEKYSLLFEPVEQELTLVMTGIENALSDRL